MQFSVRRPKKMIEDSKQCSYDIVATTSEDRPIVMEFIKNYFFRHEPLVVCLDLFEEIESLERLQNYAFKTLNNGLTLKAVSSNGDLMGVILSSIQSRDSNTNPENSDDEYEQGDTAVDKFEKFMNLFGKVAREIDLFGVYPEINRVLDIEIVAVDEAFRGRGVCKRLFDKTKELALENECSMVCVKCTSHFSSNAAKKLGFQCIYTLRYQDYTNDKGEVIFDSPSPHDQLKAYVLLL